MNAMLHWFTSAEWAQIVKALLHSLWQGAVVALVLAIVMRRLANPVSRYRCSLAALVVVVVAGMLTWAVINSSEREKPAPISLQPIAQNQIAPDYIPPLNLDSPDKIVVVVNRPPVATSLRWTAWLALVWFAGTVAMLTRAGVKVAGAEKLRRSCRPLNDANVEKLLSEARRAIGLAKKVRIGVTDKLTSPAVVGLFVPMLILPMSLLTTLTPEQIQFVLLHELAHIRRGDYLANLFQFFAESLLFFNPAVWWISHQVRREREACCDALAIELSGAPVDYARTLVHVAEKMLQPTPAAAMSLGNKREPSSLIDRVQRLLVPGYRPSLRLTWRAMLTALVLGGLLLVLSATGTRLTVAAIITPNQSTTHATNELTQTSSSVQTNSMSEEGGVVRTADETNINLRDASLRESPSVSTNAENPVVPTRADEPQLRTMTFKIDTYTGFANLRKESSLPETSSRKEQLQKLFAEAGITPPLTNIFVTDEGVLVVRGTKEQLDSVNKVVEKLNGTSSNYVGTLTQGQMDTVIKALEKLDGTTSNNSQTLPVANPMARTNLIYTSKGRQAIAAKLNSIRLKSVSYDNLPLLEIIHDLASEIKRRDPQKGINLIINYSSPTNDPSVTPTTFDLGSIRISVKSLTNVLLEDVLDNIVKASPEPIHYSVENYAVVFSRGKLNSSTSNNSQTMPVPNPMARTNLIYTSKNRQAIATKLENIRLDSVHFDKEPLSVVVSNLTQRVRVLDPDKQGVNFILETNVTSLVVTIQPAMTNVRVVDVLAAILKNEHSIKYSVEDYGVVFSPKTGEEDHQLFTRSFKTDPNTFIAKLSKQTGVTSTNLSGEMSAFIKVLSETGVKLDPPKSLFFNDKAGILIVRASAEDLDIIETVVQALNYSAPIINIKAEFIEVRQLPGNGNFVYLGSVSMSATNNAAGRNLTSNTSTTVFPRNPAGVSQINANPQNTKLLGVLSPAQANTMRAAFKSNPRAVVVSTPTVTTKSDQQAKIQIGDMLTIVKGINPLALTPPGITVTNKNDTAPYLLDQMNFGTSLDIFPHVSADGYTIHLTVIPKITAFLGYDKPTTNVTVYVNGKKQTVPEPQPQFYSDSLTNSVTVWDGQTVVLGGLISKENIEVTDKVPVLGDLPGFLGRAFRSKSSTTIKKNVIVFITPTLIDPAGNRIHTDDDMPFAREGIPVQPK